MTDVYRPDLGPVGKLRRRLTRFYARRPAPAEPGAGLVTFTFDDAPASSVQEGAAILEAAGRKGSWYISAGLCGGHGHMGRFATKAEVVDLHVRGHEVACHTFSHLDCARMTTSAFVEDVDRNRAALKALGCATETFAYPFGEVSFGPKRELSRRFTLSRTAQAGLIRRGSDLAQAAGVGLLGPDGEAASLAWIARAAAERAWVILFTHDVRPEPSPWGCTPAALSRVLDAALAAGLEVVTAAEGARRMGAT